MRSVLSFKTLLSLVTLQLISSAPTVVLVKIGGSSITHKACEETLNVDAIHWVARTLKESKKDLSFVVVHGAGSFGHHTAKRYGLMGRTQPPQLNQEDNSSDNEAFHRLMLGVGRTRLSVTKLNHAVVSAILDQNLPAAGISPCFSVPGMQVHGGDNDARENLRTVVKCCIDAGVIPILHGDAGLYGNRGAGILSGDTIMEILGQSDWISHVVFMTDVDGVFTADPATATDAVFLPTLIVDPSTQPANITLPTNDTEMIVGGSTHNHDVTGGLQVSATTIFIIQLAAWNAHCYPLTQCIFTMLAGGGAH